jgi:glycosyltransferase involved in cell wall biosynthesis
MRAITWPWGTRSTRFIYIAHGRPQHPRASLIQTLHTVDALTALGARARLYAPPLPRDFDLTGFLGEMGIRQPIDLRPSPSLHRRWGDWPFVLLHRRELRAAGAVFTRVPELSFVLARIGVPHFLEVHDTEYLRLRGLLTRLVALAAAGHIRAFVTVSAAGETALRESGADPRRVHVVPNGVDLDAYAAIPPVEAIRLSSPRAICVGRISRDRGLHLFQHIAASGHPVTLVGPRDDDPDPDVPNLTVLPAVPHASVPACYRDAELALMPYQADLRHATSISPIKLFEAMAAGRVVIVSDLAPIRELVRSGENGLLVPPDDPAAWCEAIDRVRANPERALALAEAGRRTAASFDWRARARRLLEITGLTT